MTTNCSEPLVAVFLGLGSNRDERADYLDSAADHLSALLGDLRVSSYYESDPLYLTDQPLFLNAVVGGCTDLSPRALLGAVQVIERAHGRDRSAETPKGPRTLDIDILFYGELVVQDAELRLPHPGVLERRFVLEPLVEIAGDLVHPVTGDRCRDALAHLTSQGVYLRRRNPYNGATPGEHR